MKQPEALRLAEIMDAKGSRQRNELGDYWGDSWCNKAADELRRLHEANQAMLEALKLFVIENKTHTEFERFEMARDAIAKGEKK
jgi:hypothetical protein